MKSRGTQILDITQDITYTLTPNPIPDEARLRLQETDKVVHYLLQSLSNSKFNHVHEYELAPTIWSTPRSAHHGNDQAKGRLFETYRKKYEFCALVG